jgi:hypothetical protein
MFVLRNNIDFEIANLCTHLKRKEIEKYDPFHYIFGFKQVSKPWLTIEEMYEYSNRDS